jgi:hypothetical protein
LDYYIWEFKKPHYGWIQDTEDPEAWEAALTAMAAVDMATEMTKEVQQEEEAISKILQELPHHILRNGEIEQIGIVTPKTIAESRRLIRAIDIARKATERAHDAAYQRVMDGENAGRLAEVREQIREHYAKRVKTPLVVHGTY